MKILIPFAGQLPGGNVQPEMFMGQSNGFLRAESRRMLYKRSHISISI
jgi:hypothetical protein